MGSAQEVIPCEVEGQSEAIAFNYTFMVEGLQTITTENTFLELQNGKVPGVFRADVEENYLYLVMPVRI